MKLKPVAILPLLLLTVALHADAQEKTAVQFIDTAAFIPSNAIQVNLGGLAVDYLNVSYYRALSGHHAVGVYVGYLYHPVGSERIAGYGAGLAYRYHPAAKALSRFYYSVVVGLQSAEHIDQRKDPALGLSVSGLVGWQWSLERNFIVGLGLGARVMYGKEAENDPVLKDVFGTSPIITLDMGYAW